MNNLNRIIFLCLLAVLQFACKKESVQGPPIQAEPLVLNANSVVVNDVIHGYYSALPLRYNDDSTKHPLLVWIHGSGQVGNGSSDLPRVLYGGVPKLLDEKTFPSSFTVNGVNYSFIVLAPQFKWGPGTNGIISFIDFAKQHYRIDHSRIYLAGLSQGGIIITEIAAEHPSVFAAIVPISGVFTFDIARKCEHLAKGNLPIWVFQNSNDDLFNCNDARNFVSVLKSYRGQVAPRYSEFLPYGERGHDAWTRATDPTYKEKGLNMYEWMLQYSR